MFPSSSCLSRFAVHCTRSSCYSPIFENRVPKKASLSADLSFFPFPTLKRAVFALSGVRDRFCLPAIFRRGPASPRKYPSKSTFRFNSAESYLPKFHRLNVSPSSPCRSDFPTFLLRGVLTDISNGAINL